MRQLRPQKMDVYLIVLIVREWLSRRVWFGLIGCVASSLVGAGAGTVELTGPIPAQEEQKHFHFADSHLRIELVASEPALVSPVAIAWDASGRLFVAEMRDYPNSTNGGVIRMLEDKDRDGVYETSTVFADGLHFPNSVLPWNGGVLVTAAPDLWFLKDTDGDGKADERRVLFTGFGTGNQQLRANGLTWGIDGWVYGANGRSDGHVARPGSTNRVSLRGRDFRFRPETGVLESLAGRSQFGLALDDWGNRFLSWNTIPARHEVFPDSALARNPRLPSVDVLVDLLPPGDSGEVFPLTPAPLVFNNESSSHFNALAGLTIYRAAALGPAYDGNIFVGETLRNLVHRRVLKADGATFRAERPELGTEFLRSDDPWFHPVNFATGPDGALYVVDFYRRFVEHPDFVPREMRDRMPWQAGSEHGRLWRIVRDTRRPTPTWPVGGFEKESSAALVRHLDTDNGWLRAMAQRLLRERSDATVTRDLSAAVRRFQHPASRIVAWHLLNAFGGLTSDLIRLGLDDPHPDVRAEVLRLLAEHPEAIKNESALAEKVVTRSRDLVVKVRLQAARALASMSSSPIREAALDQLIDHDGDRWVRLVAASGKPELTSQQLASLTPAAVRSLRVPPVLPKPDPDRQKIVEKFRPALALSGDQSKGAATFSRLCLACHYLQGHGQRVGPDLSGLAARPPEALLTDILDPSRQVAADYAAFEAVLVDGESVTGLFASESETRITLRGAGVADVNLPRARVKELRATGKSLMPEGLEAGWSLQDFADLLAFLRNPDGALLSP